MALKAYVLVVAEPGRTSEVAQRLQALPGVNEVNEVMGPYDIVVELEVEELEQLTNTLRQRIRPLDGVRNTVTCVAMR